MYNNKFVFFDVDETLIVEKSMFSILDEIGKKHNEVDPTEIRNQLQKMRGINYDRAEVNKEFYKKLKGLKQDETQSIAETYINKRIGDNNFLIKNIVERLRQHRLDGYEPVFVSGSSEDFINPVAKYLDVKHVLATIMTVDCNGAYTGQIVKSMISDGKRDAITNFLKKHNSMAKNCIGYGDHISDLPFLEILGFPHVVVSKDQELVIMAKKNGWPIIHPIN